MFCKPQWRAMSVARDDHGEIVPGLGMTKNNSSLPVSRDSLVVLGP